MVNLLQYNGEIYSIRKDRKINYLQFLELNKIDLLFENDGAQLSSLFNEISKRFYSDFSLKVDETINHENSYQINENKLIITYNSILKQCTLASLSSTIRSLTYANGEIWIWFVYSLGYFDIYKNQYDLVKIFMVKIIYMIQ